MDIADGRTDRLSTGRMAKSVVASFIPFRGVLREISGAAEQERLLQSAVYAGAVRRGFLKGLGQQRGCEYPARPAFARFVDERRSAVPRAKRRGDGGDPQAADTDGGQATFVSAPMVQPLPTERHKSANGGG
jgi:hypothetical protein